MTETLEAAGRLELFGPGDMVLRRLVVDDTDWVYDEIQSSRSELLAAGENQVVEEFATPEQGYQTLLATQSRNAEVSPGIELGIWAAHRPRGVVGFTLFQGGLADVWYWVGTEHTGRGLATGAVRIVLSHLSTLGRLGAIAGARLDNESSTRVLVNNGFQPIGWKEKYRIYGKPLSLSATVGAVAARTTALVA